MRGTGAQQGSGCLLHSVSDGLMRVDIVSASSNTRGILNLALSNRTTTHCERSTPRKDVRIAG